MIFPLIATAAEVVNKRVTGTLALAATRSPGAMVNVIRETEPAAAKAQVAEKQHKAKIRRTITFDRAGVFILKKVAASLNR